MSSPDPRPSPSSPTPPPRAEPSESAEPSGSLEFPDAVEPPGAPASASASPSRPDGSADSDDGLGSSGASGASGAGRGVRRGARPLRGARRLPPLPPPVRRGLLSAVGAAHQALRALGEAVVTETSSGEPLMAGAASRTLRWLPYAVAAAFTVVLIPVATQVLTSDYGLNGTVSGALGVAQSAPLLLAVTRPLPAWGIVFTADVIGALALLAAPGTLGRPWPWAPPVIVGYLVLCLALALRESRRTLTGVWLVTTLVSLVLGFVSPEHSEGTNVLLIVLSGVMLLLGAAVRERGEARRALAEQETISEAERARRTLLEERARIARELHDVVAHHMSVITVQADSAPYRIGQLPDEAREEFGSIAAAARESLAEMRRLLGVLRSEEARGERAPQPGLERLEQLVEATVRAGVPTELTVDVPDHGQGDRALDDVPPADGSGSGSGGSDSGDDGGGGASVAAAGASGGSGAAQTVTLSAYRIVQEALANVVRHAPGANTRVSVTGSEGELTVLVVNGPPPRPAGAPLESTGTGHGLVGMRERVRLVGGTLDTGPLPDGGFRVAARLPYPAPPGEDRPGTTVRADGHEGAGTADSGRGGEGGDGGDGWSDGGDGGGGRSDRGESRGRSVSGAGSGGDDSGDGSGGGGERAPDGGR